MRSLKKNAVLNVIQNMCKIIFPLITMPYASRVLGAENYGKVSYGNSIVRYFVLFSALGIATYAQREAPAFRTNKKRITDFSNRVFTINVIATIVSYVALLILLTVSFKLQDYKMLILIQSVAIILGTIGADWINVVYEDYFFITLRYVLMQCLSLAIMFLFVKTPTDYYIFAITNVIATAGGNLFNIFYIRRYVHLRLVHPRECIPHLKPILILFCVSITTIIYISSDITILGYMTTDTDVGVYTMASNIYSVVKQVISAIIVVSIPRMAYYLGNKKEEEYKSLAKNVFDSLISLLLPAITGLAALSYHVLNVMGGEEYVSGQNALIILSISLFFAILAGFYANGYLLLVKKDNKYLIATSISALLNIGLNFLLIPKQGIIGAAITTLLAEMTMTVIAAKDAIKEYGIFINGKVFLSALSGAIYVALVCYLFSLTGLGSIPIIILSFIIGLTGYFIILKTIHNPLAITVDETIKKVKDVLKLQRKTNEK